MRVWFLRVFVAFFLDFVMFWKSFHGCGLDMFLCSCFPNKPTFICLKQPLDPTLPFLAHKHSHCCKGSTFWASPSTFFMKWASPSTFFMKWREDHYLETQCAHQAQQKLRNLLSSTGPGWLIGIGLCMAFLTPIPIISLILILREPLCEYWEFTSYFLGFSLHILYEMGFSLHILYEMERRSLSWNTMCPPGPTKVEKLA